VPAQNVLEIVMFEKYIDAPAPAHIHTKNNRIITFTFSNENSHVSTRRKHHLRVQTTPKKRRGNFRRRETSAAARRETEAAVVHLEVVFLVGS